MPENLAAPGWICRIMSTSTANRVRDIAARAGYRRDHQAAEGSPPGVRGKTEILLVGADGFEPPPRPYGGARFAAAHRFQCRCRSGLRPGLDQA